MFHHQKSSKSSDQELQINLLKRDDQKRRQRDSRINFNRIRQAQNIRRNQVPTNNNRVRTGSYQQHRQRQSSQLDYFDDDNVISEIQKMPNLGQTKGRFSQSILTDTNSNNQCIGFILFLALLAFTPLQTISFVYIQPIFNQNYLEVLINVLSAQILVFIILFYFRWVERIKFKKDIFHKKKRSSFKKISCFYKMYEAIFTRAFLAIPALFIITLVWQFSYCKCLLNTVIASQSGTTDIQLIFLYITLLPQISTFIYYQDSLLESQSRKNILKLLIIYFLVFACIIDYWLALSSLAGIVLIILSIKLGRVVTYIQYFSKLVILIFLLFFKVYGNENYQSYAHQPFLLKRLGIILVMACCVLLVRCINNKTLRNQLYRYYYTDSYINCFLLLLPPFLGLFDMFISSYWLIVPYIGLLVLIYISYLVGKDRYEVNMQAPPSLNLISDNQVNYQLKNIKK